MCFVHNIYQTALGYREFDIMNLNGRLIKGVKRTDFFLDAPALSTMDQEILDQLMEGFDEDDLLTEPTVTETTAPPAAPLAELPVQSDGTVKNPILNQSDRDTDSSKEKANRFKAVTTETLDALANSTTAKSTDYQTKWAIKTLKGMVHC